MSGSSGTKVLSIARSDDPALSAADDQNVSSVLSGAAWDARTITYSFPTSSDVYGTRLSYGDPAPFNGFMPVTAQQKGEILRAFSLISSYTGLSFSEISETADTHATLRFANSFSPATAYAYYPGTYPQAGDVFFGTLGRNPVMGNSDSGQVLLHEIGHALGLKHAHEVMTYGAMNADRQDIEFSLMNYPNYIGSTEGYQTASSSPQSFMMYDIAALQHMYGASFDRVGQTDTYTWSATTGATFIDGVSQGTPVDNHIFQTIWTGGATATYDLSNFAQDQVDDMNPGGWMSFSTAQLAHLNAYAPAKTGDIFALGNVYNALRADGDGRSLIANLLSGAGNDTITGNVAGNDIRAGAGNDKAAGGAGNDTIAGGAGNDTLAGDAGNDRLDGGTGMDMLAGGGGKDVFAYAVGYGADTILDFLQADGDAIDFTAMAGLRSVGDLSRPRTPDAGRRGLRFRQRRQPHPEERADGEPGRERLHAGAGRARTDHRAGGRDQPGSGGRRLADAGRRNGVGPAAHAQRGRGRGRAVRRVATDCGGGGGERLRGDLEERGHRPVLRLEHRRQG